MVPNVSPKEKKKKKKTFSGFNWVKTTVCKATTTVSQWPCNWGCNLQTITSSSSSERLHIRGRWTVAASMTADQGKSDCDTPAIISMWHFKGDVSRVWRQLWGFRQHAGKTLSDWEVAIGNGWKVISNKNSNRKQVRTDACQHYQAAELQLRSRALAVISPAECDTTVRKKWLTCYCFLLNLQPKPWACQGCYMYIR